jgi:hypothetical protein
MSLTWWVALVWIGALVAALLLNFLLTASGDRRP